MKPTYIAIVLGILLLIMVIALPIGPGWLTSVTLPVRNGVTEVFASGWRFVHWFGDIGGLSEERDELAGERNRLLSRVAELEAAERQNVALRRQLEAEGIEIKGRLLVAQTAGVVDQGGVSLILINKGSADGIKEGQAVLSDGVLVGRIRRVSERSATVQPPQSLGSIIPVSIRYGSEVTKGVVEGNYNLTTQLNQVLLEEKLEEGSIILTSGEGGTYPANLVVGKVGTVRREASQLFQSAEVELLWDIGQLETVFVLQEVGR